MDVRRIRLALLAGFVALAMGAAPAWSGLPTRVSKAVRPARPAKVMTLDNQRRIDINNINMYLTNYGSFGYDLGTGNSGLYFPKGTSKTAVYAAGLWLGAVDSATSEKRVTVSEYSQEFGPGIMISPTASDDHGLPQYHVYKMKRWTGDPADSTHVERTVDPSDVSVPDPIVHHSWAEYMAGAAPYGAPVKTYRLPVTDTSDPSDSVDVLGPDVSGDLMCWAVYNDADATRHTNNAGGSNPLGVEVRQTTFGFNRQGALGNTIFLKFEIKNKGTNVLKNMFVSLWSDPDLGDASDDLVGCDTTLSLGFVYNATNNDAIYGLTPPCVGYDFFLGPRTAAGDTLPLTSFNKYINGTDPASTDESYNYMQGLLPDGSPLINPQNGEETHFFDPGDPVTGTGWLDDNASDRRLMLSSGPFTMEPGDSQVVVGAIIIAQGSDRLASITGMKFFDKAAQAAFDLNFNLCPPPPQPKVSVNVSHGQVQLCWDSASQFNYSRGTRPECQGYNFEGYVVYQGETIAGPWKRLITYDVPNGITVVRDTVFDATSGQLITDFPVAFGGDNGISFCYTTTQDAIRGGPLNDATQYYFAVTSYAVDLAAEPRVLENAQQAIVVTPERPPLGTDINTAASVNFTHTLFDSTKAPGTDVVTATVVDPTVITGDCYKVTFSDLPSPVIVGPDTVRVGWNLINTTTGDTLLRNQFNRTPDLNYQVVQGLLVRVAGQYTPKLQNISYLNLNPEHRRALEGVNFGLTFFDGGGDYGANFFGSTLDPATMPDSFTTVEVRFDPTGTNVQKAYRFMRYQKPDGTAPASFPDRGYLYGGFHTVPFQVWDATNNIQLDAAFLEKVVVDDAGNLLPGLATTDSTWGPDASGDGGREYLFIYRRPYSDTPKPELMADKSVLEGTVPVMYTAGPKLRADTDVIDPGDMLQFLYANPATANDLYTFCTTQLQRGNVALVKSGLSRIRVVPNPYYTRSRYELSQFNRVVRFINMPEAATVKIFNLAGQLVRTLKKTDPTISTLDWDLLNENQLPIASGIYIYHVDAPGAGSTFGRMVVFMEKERLNTF